MKYLKGKKKRLGRLATMMSCIGVLALVLAACGSSSGTAAGKTTSGTTSTKATSGSSGTSASGHSTTGITTTTAATATVRSTGIIIGEPLSPPKVPQLAVYVATALGYFHKAHLAVTIAPMPTGLATELGTTSGTINFGMAAGTDSIEAAAQGAKIHAIWVDYQRLDTVCIGGTGIKSVKDLIGKNVGSTGAGGFSATTMGACLKAGGVTPTQVKEITMTRSEFVPALHSGRIAAAVFHADTAYVVLHSVKGAHVLDYEYKTLPTYWYGSLNVIDSYAQANPKVTEETIGAMMAADRWMMNPKNNAAFVKLAMKHTGETEKAVQHAISFDRDKIKLWNTGCTVSQQSVQATAKILMNQGSITSIPSFSDVYNGQYCKAALKIAAQLAK